MSETEQSLRDALMKILWIAPFDSEIYLLARDALNRTPSAAQTLEDPTPTERAEAS